MDNNLEKNLKKWLKRKVKFTQAMMVAFLISGGIAYSESIDIEKDRGYGVIYNSETHSFDDVKIKIEPYETVGAIGGWGLGVGGSSDIEIKGNTNVAYTSANRFEVFYEKIYYLEQLLINDRSFSPGDPIAIGIIMGSNDPYLVEDRVSKLTTKDVTINVTNTKDTIKGKTIDEARN